VSGAKPVTIALASGAATTYNPYGLPATSFGYPAKAIDGDPLRSWTYQLDPSTQGATEVGLAIDLSTPQTVREITLATGSPGMTVEFYGAASALPATITTPGWVHLATRRSIDAQTTVALASKGQKLDYVLVWITHAPAGVNAGALSLSDVSVAG
jgi:putative peptidoglycan lipid II flippase